MQQVVNCQRCGTANYWGQPYCVGCGAPMAVSCTRCGTWMAASSPFCTNCGQPMAQAANPQAHPQSKPSKPPSTWGVIGGALFTIGILIAMAGPVLVMLKPEAEQNTSDIIKWVAVGAVIFFIGLPMMFKR